MAERREKVVLILEDHFSTEMAKAAATTALLNRELNALSGKSVETSRDSDALGRSVKGVGTEVQKTSAQFQRSGKEIDKFSGRFRLLADAALTLGPALIPLSAAAVPAITGLAAGLGAAAGAAGVALLAFNGLGDGLKALDAYQLEPTAENLQKMRLAMADLGPAGADFARFIDGLEPQLHALQDTARSGLFPGLQKGIEELLPLLPRVQRIIGDIASEMGNLATGAGAALAGPEFRAFFDYLETDAAATLHHFAEATGNVIQGLGSLMAAFGPLSGDFSTGLERMTQSFADWAAGLSQTQGFQDFVAYIRESGPQAIELLGAIGNAFVGIVTAAAPWGSVVLPALTGLANVLSTIASSPIGPPLFTAAAGLIALNRATSLLGPGLGSLSEAFLDLRTSPNIAATAMQRFGGVAKVAAGAAGVGLFVASLNETNQTLAAFEGAAGGALAGFSVGGPWGAAIGGAIGLVASLGTAHENSAAEVDDLAAAFDRQTGAITENVRTQAVQKLQQDGSLDAAQRLGISTELVTDAVLGNARAQETLNAALAGYDVDHSISAVDDLKASYSDAQIQMILNNRAATQLRDNLPGLTSVFDAAGAQAKQFASAMGGTGRAAERTSKQLLASRDAAGQTAQGFLEFGDSLNDSKKSLDDWIKSMQQQADALRNFAKNAVDAARKGLDEGLIKKLQEAGPEGALRMKQLADATKAQIDRANKAWRSGGDAANFYKNTIGGIKNPKLDVDDAKVRAKLRAAAADLRKYGLTKAQSTLLVQDLASGKVKTVQGLVDKYGLSKKAATALLNDLASGKIRGIQGLLNSLHDKTVTINTVHNDSYNSKRSQMPSADGGFVPKTGLPYADRHPYLLADGEGVTTNRRGETDRFRDVISGINAGMTRGQIKGMLADGGFAGPYARAGRTGGTPSFGLVGEVGDAFIGVLSGINNLGERQLRIRAKQLDREERLAEKSLSQAKERIDEERQQLQELRDQRKQFMDQVTGNFRTDVFGGNVDLTQAALSGQLGSAFSQGIGQWMQANGSHFQLGMSQPLQSDLVQQYLATLSPQELAAYQAQASVGQIQQDSHNAQAFEQVLEQLQQMGLTGGAFSELAASGNMAQAQAYLAMGPDFIKTLMKSFKQREDDLRNLGKFVGNAQFGADIRDQLKETRRAVRIAEEQRNELREIKQAQRDVARRLDRIEKNSPKETGKAVAEAVNGAVKHGQRSAS